MTRNEKIIARAQASGSTADTIRGAVKFCVQNRLADSFFSTANPKPLARTNLDDVRVGGHVELDSGVCYGFRFVAREDSDARVFASEKIGACGQRSNYSTGCAKIYGSAVQARWEKINYKGSFRGYTGSHLYQDYQSCLAVSWSG